MPVKTYKIAVLLDKSKQLSDYSMHVEITRLFQVLTFLYYLIPLACKIKNLHHITKLTLNTKRV
jgi:hypothetical protein